MPVFPPSGGGNASWFTNAQIYVSPTGNDSADGTGWNTAKKHIYNGIHALNLLGGGTLFLDNNCAVGGPVSGQGIWLRQDSFPIDTGFFDVPGFLPFAPMRIVGVGGAGINFGPPASAFTGGGNSTFKPAIWVVGGNGMQKLEMLGLQNTNLVNGAMIGVDWDRELDGSVKQIAISNATRTSTTTVFTVTLPTALTVTRGSRTSNVTTLTIPNPGLPWPPFRKDVPVAFTSGDSDFPSGNFVITTQSNPFQFPATWTISYADPGADVPDKAIAGSSIKTHGCCAGELIDVTSNTVDFLGTQYMVNSVTATTITVTDVFGNGNKNDNNIGTLAHQERFYTGTNGFVGNFNLSINNGDATSRHSLDVGHNAAIAPLITGGWYEGYVGNGTGARDERRMSAMYVYAGTATEGPPVASLTARDFFTDNGMVYAEPGDNPGTIDVRRVTGETNYPLLGLPLLRVDGGPSTAVVAEDILNADADPTLSTVLLNNLQPTAAEIYRCGIVSGACVGGDRFDSPALWGSPGANGVTPWQRKQVTAWADGRTTGKHPGVVRGMAPFTARFKNIVAASGSWTLRGSTLTASQPAPDGSSTADKIVFTDFVSIFPNGLTGDTFATGGKFAVCGWVNAPDSSGFVADELFRVISDGNVWTESGTGTGIIATPYTGVGWQFVSGFLTVGTVTDSTPNIEVDFRAQVASTTYLWGLTAFYVPPGDNNDVYELLGTLHHQPRYLPVGQSGTMEGQRLNGDGGLTVGKSGFASGTVEMFDGASAAVSASGTGAFRYNAGTNKIQYSKNGGAWTDLV